ncbi:MAG: glycosyltransferase family protein [Alphaproteobacteria bacterium]|nr:glycosyltransferase family protein [Alphaproteobacteria bacterium]
MSRKRIIAVVPVRMGSSRLPGKMLMPICGKPLLGHLLDRLMRCRSIDGIVVATSENPENDPVELYCATRNVACFRGDENDVLGRLLGALDSQGADIGVLAFGDAPLLDPAIVDAMVKRFLFEKSLDFVGNDLVTTFPPGMEVEVFRVDALRDSAQRANDPAIREHGTLYIRQNPKLYGVLNVEAGGAQRRPELEIEVDTLQDARVIDAIVVHFGGRDNFTLDEIIAFLDANPELRTSNQNVPRLWKQYRDDPL